MQYIFSFILLILGYLTVRFEKKEQHKKVKKTALLIMFISLVALAHQFWKEHIYETNRPFITYSEKTYKEGGHEIGFFLKNYGNTPIKDFEFTIVDEYSNDFAASEEGTFTEYPIKDIQHQTVNSECPSNIIPSSSRNFYYGFIKKGVKNVKYIINISWENGVYTCIAEFYLDEKTGSFKYTPNTFIVDGYKIDPEEYFTNVPEKVFTNYSSYKPSK